MTETDIIKNALVNVSTLAKHSEYYNHDRDHADIELIESIVKKEIHEKPKLIARDGCDDDEIIYDLWVCPCCREYYRLSWDQYDYCPKCGQHIDRLEIEEVLV